MSGAFVQLEFGRFSADIAIFGLLTRWGARRSIRRCPARCAATDNSFLHPPGSKVPRGPAVSDPAARRSAPAPREASRGPGGQLSWPLSTLKPFTACAAQTGVSAAHRNGRRAATFQGESAMSTPIFRPMLAVSATPRAIARLGGWSKPMSGRPPRLLALPALTCGGSACTRC